MIVLYLPVLTAQLVDFLTARINVVDVNSDLNLVKASIYVQQLMLNLTV
jgi:hypothetical protein